MVICLEQGADLHMAQLMPLPLTVSCFSKIQIGFTFLVLAHLGSPGQGAVKQVCVQCIVKVCSWEGNRRSDVRPATCGSGPYWPRGENKRKCTAAELVTNYY